MCKKLPMSLESYYYYYYFTPSHLWGWFLHGQPLKAVIQESQCNKNKNKSLDFSKIFLPKTVKLVELLGRNEGKTHKMLECLLSFVQLFMEFESFS